VPAPFQIQLIRPEADVRVSGRPGDASRRAERSTIDVLRDLISGQRSPLAAVARCRSAFVSRTSRSFPRSSSNCRPGLRNASNGVSGWLGACLRSRFALLRPPAIACRVLEPWSARARESASAPDAPRGVQLQRTPLAPDQTFNTVVGEVSTRDSRRCCVVDCAAPPSRISRWLIAAHVRVRL